MGIYKAVQFNTVTNLLDTVPTLDPSLIAPSTPPVISSGILAANSLVSLVDVGGILQVKYASANASCSMPASPANGFILQSYSPMQPAQVFLAGLFTLPIAGASNASVGQPAYLSDSNQGGAQLNPPAPNRGVWHALTSYTAGDQILDTNGNWQTATTGISGAAMPVWSTICGGTTPDAGVTWTMSPAHIVQAIGPIVFFDSVSSLSTVNFGALQPSFGALTGGVNTSATMIVGSGASLNASGTGTISATSLQGVAVSTTPPTLGQVLTATSPTTANWQAPASPTVGGANTDVQYNNSGVFGGDAGFTYNNVSHNVAVAGLITVGVGPTGNIVVPNASLVIDPASAFPTYFIHNGVNGYFEIRTDNLPSPLHGDLMFNTSGFFVNGGFSSPGLNLYSGNGPAGYGFGNGLINCFQSGSAPHGFGIQADTGSPTHSKFYFDIDDTVMQFFGVTSGVGAIGVNTVAGNPLPILLPVNTGLPGQFLQVQSLLGSPPTEAQLDWAFPATSIGGVDTDVQVNSGGAFYGDSNFTWNHVTRALTINGVSGAGFIMDSGGDTEVLGGVIGTAFVAHSATNVGVSGHLYTLSMDPGSTGTGGLQIVHNLGSGPALVWDNATGYLYLRNTSGLAGIGVAAAAGTPAVMLLPTTTGTAGQALITNGASPQQLSWATIAGITGSILANQVVFGAATDELTGSNSFTFDGTTLTVTGLTYDISTGVLALTSGLTFTEFQANDISISDGVTLFNIAVAAAKLRLGSSNATVDQGGNFATLGTYTVVGGTSGSASIGAATNAGTPNQINLPTTTGIPGSVLATDGNNPQQSSWTTTFNNTSAVPWSWVNTTPATSIITQTSTPSLNLVSHYWDGFASQPDTWTIGATPGGLSISHVGSSLNGNISLDANTFINGALTTEQILIYGEQYSGAVFTLTNASASVGGQQTLTGNYAVNFPLAGMWVTIVGFVNAANNGTFQVFSSTTGSIVVWNHAGVVETHAATSTTGTPYFPGGGSLEVTTVGNGTINIQGVAQSISTRLETLPQGVSLVLSQFGNPFDAGFLTPIGNGATQMHGFQIGAIYDGTGANPGFLQWGQNDAVPVGSPPVGQHFMNLLMPDGITGLTATGTAFDNTSVGTIAITASNDPTNFVQFGLNAALNTATLLNSTPATTLVPAQSAPALHLAGQVWNGVASVTQSWNLTSLFAVAPNESSLTLAYSAGGGRINITADVISINNILQGSTAQFSFTTGSAGAIYPVTSVANAVGNLATYQYTSVPGGAPNQNQYLNITGFTNPSNNGRFIVFSASNTQVTVYNVNAVAETHAATAVVDANYYDQAGFNVYMGQTPLFPIGASHLSGALGLEQLPLHPQLIFNVKGNATDAAYFRNITDGPTGNHGFEWGVFTDGPLQSPPPEPLTLQIGSFGGVSTAVLNVPLTLKGTSSGSAAIGVAANAGTPNKILLPTTTGAPGQSLVTDGNNPQQLSWSSAGTGTIGGTIALDQVAVGTGVNTIGGSSSFTFDGTSFNLSSATGQFMLMGNQGGHNVLEISSGIFNCDIVLDQVSGITMAIAVGQTISVGSVNGTWVFDGLTGYLQAHGHSSGFAAIGVAANAGTPNPMLFPTTTGTPGQVLTTNGANPQQLSWTTPGGSGIPPVNLVLQSANVPPTVMYAAPLAGLYRISVYLVVSQPAGGSPAFSTLPDSRLTFTDQDSNATITFEATAPLSDNTSSDFSQGTYLLNVKAATNILYDIGQVTSYESSGAGSPPDVMQFAYRARVEYLG